MRTLLRALGTKNDARYNLKIVDNGEPGAHHSNASHEDRPASDTTKPAPAAHDDEDDEANEESTSSPSSDRLARTRKELEELDDLDV